MAFKSITFSSIYKKKFFKELEIRLYSSSLKNSFKCTILMLFFLFIFQVQVFALDRYEGLLNSKKIAFTFDGFSNKSASVHYTLGLNSRLNDVSVKIIGSGGKIISEGAEGTFTTSVYPVMIAMSPQRDPNWSARVILTVDKQGNGEMTGGIGGGGAGPSITGNDCCKNYDRILNNILNALAPLKPIQKVLEGILLEVRDINHFLHDKEALNQGVSAVQDSVKALENYDATAGVKDSIKNISNVKDSDLPVLNVEVIKGHSFNILDLSKFKEQIKMLKSLVSAMLWIELAMFFVRIFVPKLKV